MNFLKNLFSAPVETSLPAHMTPPLTDVEKALLRSAEREPDHWTAPSCGDIAPGKVVARFENIHRPGLAVCLNPLSTGGVAPTLIAGDYETSLRPDVCAQFVHFITEHKTQRALEGARQRLDVGPSMLSS